MTYKSLSHGALAKVLFTIKAKQVLFFQDINVTSNNKIQKDKINCK